MKIQSLPEISSDLICDAKQHVCHKSEGITEESLPFLFMWRREWEKHFTSTKIMAGLPQSSGPGQHFPRY